MAEFVAWLFGGIGAAAVAGLVVGLVGRTRREAWVLGFLAGLVSSGIALGVSTPYGGGLWEMWTALGAVWAGAGGAGLAALVTSLRRRRRTAKGRTEREPSASP